MIAHLALGLSLLTPPERPLDHWFGSDKVKHFFMAAFTQSVTYSALQLAGVRHEHALASAWAVTAAVSVGKEVHDRKVTGLFSVRDLVWDAAGAGAASALIYNAVRSNADEPKGISRLAGGEPLGASLLSSTVRGPILAASAWPQWRRAGALR
jgi:putative lipoprotein